ncbi:transcription factor GTE11 isoform X2 [Arabidopsis lyrata subsp. lyrata]|uniref:transcription factor GTE11 isoform X2 n=1 Tax=Arabidopsis lyrata subsp. lyrata TaxID=81972 RepID=UPI000A29E952|nr:transcription factor GTE11 isoform X2 [Arabidopsis lyrata subsp. lyrata]|eukprot:XP_020887815.1 transcription factor GTE11 isoform X2 [Arabidopsis lyrata subsp. lyrata]
MTVRNGGFPGDYYRTSFDTPGGCDDSPNTSEDETFGVPRMVLPLSDLSSSERKKLIHTLRQELEQIRSFQKSLVDLPMSNIVTPVSNNMSRPKSFRMARCSTGPGKRVLPFSATKPEPVTTSTMLRMKQCETLLKRLMSQQHCWLFNTPVDMVKLNIPDYFTIIKHPMDLGTVKSKLTSGTYSSPSEFSADVRLTFRNAMTYNPSDNNVYRFADTLSKFFEVRWKTFNKKSSGTKSEPSNLGTLARKDIAMPEPLAKKRKMNAVNHDSLLEPAKRVMTDEDRVKLGRDLGSLTEFPVQIINFLRDHSSKEGRSGDDEIEIDINDLSHDALFQLRDLFDEFLRENQRKDINGEPCELELLDGSGPGNSLTQHCGGSEMEDEDVDIGNYEHPRSHIPSVRTEKGSRSSESVPDDPKTTRLLSSSKVPESMDSESPLDGATSSSPRRKHSVSGLNQLEDASKGSLIEGADGHLDGNSAPNEKQLPPEKRYRAALLKDRFADIILKAKEITLNQNEKRDPEKLRREKEEIELQKKKEKARLQAEAKEAEEARRKAEAQAAVEAAAEAKRKLELERKAARQALLEMEKSVEINENTRFLKDLELLKTVKTDQLRNLRDVGSDSDGLEVFGFGGSNPLEQLGLFMKHDEDEDEADLLAFPDPGNEVEEGEID